MVRLDKYRVLRYSRAPVRKRIRLAPSNVLDPSRRLLTCVLPPAGNDGTRLHKFQIEQPNAPADDERMLPDALSTCL
jgi:hypothetical protein